MSAGVYDYSNVLSWVHFGDLGADEPVVRRYEAPPRQPGDNTNAIGACPETGILKTQLGPNKNGRKW